MIRTRTLVFSAILFCFPPLSSNTQTLKIPGCIWHVLFLKWRIQRSATLCYGILHVTHLRRQRLVKENEKIQKEKLGQNQKTRKSEQQPLSLSKTHGFENFSRSGKLVDRGLTTPKIQSLCPAHIA